MKYWFTADTHFGHKNIIKYCNRPFKDITHMNETIIKNWNSKVSTEDVVFHLGDFSMMGGAVNKFITRLNGHIIWIQGNHDKKTIIQDIIIEHGGHNWHLAHNPQDCEGEYNICGHVHEKWKVKIRKNGKCFVNVGVDQWDFQPISISQINKALEDYKNGVREIPQDKNTG